MFQISTLCIFSLKDVIICFILKQQDHASFLKYHWSLFLSTCSHALFQLFGQQQTFTQSLLGSGQQNFSQINSQLNAQASDTNDMNAESSNQLNSGNQYNTLTNQVNSQVAAQLNTQIGGFNQNQFSMQVTSASFSYCTTI